MAERQPGSSGEHFDEDGASPVPDQVWQRFLEDSDSSILGSAPREPSARERAALARLRALDVPAVQRPSEWRPGGGDRDAVAVEAVGELWQPEDLRPGPAWHELDQRGRRRRGARVLGTIVAVVALVGALSQLSAGSTSETYGDDGDTASQQSEESSEPLPTAAGGPSVPPSTSTEVPGSAAPAG
ncbi:hypothetical protein ACYF6T_12475 [Streptomyces sp. 7R007]